MSYRRKHTLEVRTLLSNLKATLSDRRVSRNTGMHRQTVSKYRQWASEQGLLEGKLPGNDELQSLLDRTLPTLPAPQNVSSVADYDEMVRKLRGQSVEVRAIHERLRERGYSGSYSSVLRYVRRIETCAPDACVRVETLPGAEAQVDFGSAGLMRDPQTGEMRRAWMFVMTLSYSRHQYVEFAFNQSTPTWLALHIRAFRHFDGVPGRLVPDNLKAAVIKASWDDPVINRAYGEMAEHYGFLIAPCRPATPQHKGKVESGVHYVARNFLAGREKTDISRANADVLAWVKAVGARTHGTTRKQPLTVFDDVEKGHLTPLPVQPFDLPTYKKVKLHRDCHVVFEQSYYSAPVRMVGQTLWLRAGLSSVCLYDQQQFMVATHSRATEPGERSTHPDHLPPLKLRGLVQCRQSLIEAAESTGPATAQFVEALLSDRVIDKAGTAGRLLRLGERHTPERLEAACARAAQFGQSDYGTVKSILAEGLETAPAPAIPAAPVATTFARSADELFGALVAQGGGPWM